MTEPVTTPTASAARLAANRANAQRSTGPRTEDGKHRSSLNALRAGLTGQTVILPSDDLQNYAAFTKRLIDSYEPVGPREHDLAYTIAAERWRLHRVRTLENAMFGSAVIEESGNFDVTVERQPDPGSAEPQSPVPDSGEAEAVHATLAQARKLLEQHRAFLNLSLYEQRVYRVIEKASAELQRLQTGRKAPASAQASAPNPVPSPQLPVPSEAQPPDSPEIGFVFASTEVRPQAGGQNRSHSPRLTAVLAQKFPLIPLELATLTAETRKQFVSGSGSEK
ncbi:MAG: hypothetical protein JO336_18075 [Acidobacteriia bacterium]|nr:hypothetical protein [Terriglobia bacterium]MBV8906139.1 hypothetical protein [Terriglobia bacterium]